TQFMGAMRHKDPLLCPLGALSQYLFWRWQVDGEPAPDFRTRSSWYDLKLLFGKDKEDRTKTLSYTAQYEAIWGIFADVGITSVKKTHAMRGCAAQQAELHGVSEKQVSIYPSISRSLYINLLFLTDRARRLVRLLLFSRRRLPLAPSKEVYTDDGRLSWQPR